MKRARRSRSQPAGDVHPTIVHAGDRLRGDYPAVVGNRGLFFTDGDPTASRPTTVNLLAQRLTDEADSGAGPRTVGAATTVMCIRTLGAGGHTDDGAIAAVRFGDHLPADLDIVKRFPEWIAITKAGDDLHAVACRGSSVLFDLAGGPDRLDLSTVMHGLILVRTT